MPTARHRYFLYAEDDPDDQETLVEMVARIDPDIEVIVCTQGQELMQFLESVSTGDYLPCCIILDMNMPLWDGIFTLKELKKNKLFSHLPVVMFTTSNSPEEADHARQLGAEAFITKPVRMQELKDVAEQFSFFCKKPPSKRQ